jgi:hypothetical protein
MPAGLPAEKMLVGKPVGKPTVGSASRPLIPTYVYDVRIPVGERTGVAERMNLQSIAIEEMNRLDALALFHCPSEMRVGIAETVAFDIKQDLNLALQRNLESRGVASAQANKISTSVKTELLPDKDGSFHIRPMETSGNGSWKSSAWSVTPKETGEHTLSLKISIIVSLPDMDDGVASPVLAQTVLVKSNPIYRFGEFVRGRWVWIMGATAILSGILAWIVRRQRVLHTR